ncbi:MAG: hypothetical protein HY819_13015 [Acidobacteria bacterium]|nr:hypothetical protein [Acidobacteriota bacterium]
MKKLILSIALIMTTFIISANSQAPFNNVRFNPDGKYLSDVPKPEDVIGHQIGEYFTHYSELASFYRRIAETSSRVKLIEYGRTYERRKLQLIVISSPENLANIENIKKDTARLSDPRKLSNSEMEKLIAKMPATVWLNYNVHGDESCSAETAMEVVYHLAADQSEETNKLLKELVIVIDPLVNPDGRERYVHFYEQAQGKVAKADKNSLEHNQSWPGGRFNHYLFDLNRDWAWLTQTESQSRVKTYQEWLPQVFVDFHEMNVESTYFFPPSAKPQNANIPSIINNWLKIYGQGNTAAFDKYGLSFYTSEDFDLLYPSYGDSWPSLNGAVGMTYEQGGSGRAGLSIRLDDRQKVLTLRERAWHHFLTSIATLKTTADNRVARLKDYYKFREQAIEAGKKETMKSFVLLPGNDPSRSAKLVNLLVTQGIEVERVKTSFKAKKAHSYLGETIEEKEFPAGAYVINLAQPAGFLAKGLLEPEAVLKDLYFYDITGWSLPLAYNVQTYWLEELVSSNTEKITSTLSPTGQVIGGRATYGYVFSYESNAAAKTLSQLLQEDFDAFLVLKPITINGKDFPLGSIVVPIESNKANLHERIAQLAASNGHDVMAASSARSQNGIDLGSNRVRYIRKPKVVVVMGPGTNVTNYGSIWHLLDERYGIPFIAVSTQQLGGLDLRDYNTIILPDDDGTGRSFLGLIGKSTVDKISRWVRDGGTFVGIKGGAVFATAKMSGLTSVTYRLIDRQEEEERIEREKQQEKQDKDSAQQNVSTLPALVAKTPEEQLAEKLVPYEEKERRRMMESIPGTLMKLKLDNTHPLGMGYDKDLVVLNNTSPVLSLTTKGDNIIYYPKEQFKISGFITPENEKKLSHSAYLLRERAGRGSFILYADDPVFRSFWEGTTRLFLNSILFGSLRDPNVE